MSKLSPALSIMVINSRVRIFSNTDIKFISLISDYVNPIHIIIILPFDSSITPRSGHSTRITKSTLWVFLLLRWFTTSEFVIDERVEWRCRESNSGASRDRKEVYAL